MAINVETLSEETQDQLADDAQAQAEFVESTATTETVVTGDDGTAEALTSAMEPASDDSDESESENDDDDESESDEAGAKDKSRLFVMCTMPENLFNAVDADAKKQGIGRAALVRQLLANNYGITLPAPTSAGGRKKYATEAERKQARKDAAKSRAELIKQLMEDHKAKLAAAEKAASEATKLDVSKLV